MCNPQVGDSNLTAVLTEPNRSFQFTSWDFTSERKVPQSKTRDERIFHPVWLSHMMFVILQDYLRVSKVSVCCKDGKIPSSFAWRAQYNFDSCSYVEGESVSPVSCWQTGEAVKQKLNSVLRPFSCATSILENAVLRMSSGSLSLVSEAAL